MEKKLDYLIIGQGLAGSFIAYTALLKNKKIKVIASDEMKASSEVAAGIINSVVIKRINKSWRANDFNKYISNFYPTLENYLDLNFFHKTHTLKLINSEEEEEFWKMRKKAGNLEEFISENIKRGQVPEAFKLEKSAEIFKTYRIDVVDFLKKFRKKLVGKGIFQNEKFDYDALIVKNDSIIYKNIDAKKIIFCEGIHAKNNPYFNWLPFSFNKGEILTISAPELKLDSVINKKIFTLPIGNNLYKIGSSYEWKKLNNDPTIEKREEISGHFENICSIDYNITKQEAGIRPSTRDRRPIIGKHPKFNNLFIFNGMGAKAALMAPLLAKEALDFLEAKGKLIKNVLLNDIINYTKLIRWNNSSL